MLTPDEFFERVGVRVPDSVIRNLEAATMTPEEFFDLDRPGCKRPTEGRIAFERAMEQLELLDPQPGEK